jgi:hypothetical protein
MDENFRMHWARERARRASLAAMGITPFVSRFDAPGAKASERFHLPDEELSEPTPARQGVTERGPVDQLRVALGRRDGQGLPEVEAEAANHVTPAIKGQGKPRPPAAAENEPQSRFLVNSGDVLWVEVLEDQLLRQEQLQLVAAMARAIRGVSVRCEHQQFDWPPSGQGALAAADNGMAEVLSGFLQRLTRDHSTELMVLMGDCDCLPSSDIPQYRIPSSLSMLRDGSLKETAWAILKPLNRSA